MWKCTICNYVACDKTHECPKCKAKEEALVKLEDNEKELVNKSRRTNWLHEELAHYLHKIVPLAEEGIAENLDPACVAIFEDVKAHAHETIQKIKAELEGHMKKGKWG